MSFQYTDRIGGVVDGEGAATTFSTSCLGTRPPPQHGRQRKAAAPFALGDHVDAATAGAQGCQAEGVLALGIDRLGRLDLRGRTLQHLAPDTVQRADHTRTTRRYGQRRLPAQRSGANAGSTLGAIGASGCQQLITPRRQRGLRLRVATHLLGQRRDGIAHALAQFSVHHQHIPADGAAPRQHERSQLRGVFDLQARTRPEPSKCRHTCERSRHRHFAQRDVASHVGQRRHARRLAGAGQRRTQAPGRVVRVLGQFRAAHQQHGLRRQQPPGFVHTQVRQAVPEHQPGIRRDGEYVARVPLQLAVVDRGQRLPLHAQARKAVGLGPWRHRQIDRQGRITFRHRLRVLGNAVDREDDAGASFLRLVGAAGEMDPRISHVRARHREVEIAAGGLLEQGHRLHHTQCRQSNLARVRPMGRQRLDRFAGGARPDRRPHEGQRSAESADTCCGTQARKSAVAVILTPFSCNVMPSEATLFRSRPPSI